MKMKVTPTRYTRGDGYSSSDTRLDRTLVTGAMSGLGLDLPTRRVSLQSSLSLQLAGQLCDRPDETFGCADQISQSVHSGLGTLFKTQSNRSPGTDPAIPRLLRPSPSCP